MKRKLIALLILSLFLWAACNEDNVVEINDMAEVGVTFGGNQIDIGYFGHQTEDGGFIITGLTQSYATSGSDIWLIKTDSQGNVQWDYTYGGVGEDFGSSVRETENGGFIIVGSMLVKTQSQGSEDWINEEVSGNAVQTTIDGGYIISGTLSDDISLIKTDSNGNIVWSKTYDGKNFDEGRSVVQTSDNGFIITGCTDCNSYSDVILIKTDSAGDTLWTRTYGGYDNEFGNYVQQTTDGGYIITGQTQSFGNGYSDIWLIKTDSAGDTLWTRTFGGESLEVGSCVQQTTDGGYIITGINFSLVLPDHGDVWLVKTDTLGNEIWNHTYGGVGLDWGRSVQQTTDGGYVVVGWREVVLGGQSDSDVWLIITDPEGNADYLCQ